MINNRIISNIINDLGREIEEQVGKMYEELKEKLNFINIEEQITSLVKRLVAQVIEWLINQVLSEVEILRCLKILGGRKALRYKEYREISVRIGNGETINIASPYFLRTEPKRGRKKVGPNGSGSHLGLEGVQSHNRITFCKYNISNSLQVRLVFSRF